MFEEQIGQSLGQIDISLCAQVVANTVTDKVVPLGIGLALMTFAFVIFSTLYIINARELALAKDYLRRRNALTEFENWKRDREVKAL